MDELFYGLLGCSILLGLPGVLVWILVRQHRRLTKLEAALEDQGQRLSRLAKTLAEGGPAGEDTVRSSVRTPISAAPAITESPEPDSRSRTSTGAGLPTAEAPPPPPSDSVATTPEASASVDSVGPALEDPSSLDDEGVDTAPSDTHRPASGPPASEAARETPPPSRWQGLEEKIWTRLPVWLGAIAVALAAAYMVRLSFERGWIQPPVRVAFGALLGTAFLVVGERMKRANAYLAQGLSASGIASLFVAFYAASELYDLVPPWVGFVLMALTTATAVALSLRQGYVVAVIGLVGGFLTPALLGETDSSLVLFSYLLMLQVGLILVTRQQRWPSLGILTLIAGLGWVFSFLGGPFEIADAPWVGLFLLLSVASFFVSLVTDSESLGPASVARMIAWGAGGGGLIAAGTLTRMSQEGTLEWAFFGLLALGCVALARLDERHHGLAWLGAVVGFLMLEGWASSIDPALDPGAPSRFLWTLGLLGASLAGAAYVAHFGSEFPGRWCSLVGAVSVTFFLVAIAHDRQLGLEDFHWGIPSVLLAVVLLAAALPDAQRRAQAEPDPRIEHSLAALAVGVTAFLALAVPLELERAWSSVAWALQTWALVWLASRLEVPALRICAGLLAAFVGVRLLLNPAVLDYPIGKEPVWNWLLYGYGVPIVAFGAAAINAELQRATRLTRGLAALVAALIVAMLTLQIRQYFSPGDLGHGSLRWIEAGTHGITWLALAWLAASLFGLLRRWLVAPVLLWSYRILYLGGILGGALFVGLALNPLWTSESVGSTPLVNRLLFVYGLPILLLLVVARLLGRHAERGLPGRRLAVVGRIAALVTFFLLVTLEVRHLFQGPLLDQGAPGTRENYAYSVAWLLMGIGLAVLAVARAGKGQRLLRFASLAALIPAVLKVFLFDTSDLEGFFRVFSLLGLGLSLFLIAYLFRRYVFVGTPVPNDEAASIGSEPEP